MTEKIERYIYIASPYSHPCKYEMHKRFQQVTDYAAECLERGEIVYSPIAHNHHMQLSVGLPNTWEFWRRIDFAFLGAAKELRVYCLEGWDKSVGVTEDAHHALERQMTDQQQIRATALQAAATSLLLSGGPMTATEVIRRAKMFEEYIRTGNQP